VFRHPTVAATKVVLSIWTTIGRFAGNPEPVTLILSAVDVPTTPDVGETATVGTNVLTDAVAVLEKESATTIVCAPAKKAGMVNVWIICPAVNTAVPTAVGVIPSTVRVGRVTVPLAKPDPTIVTVEPPVALEGLTTLMDGAPVFVNVAEPAIPVVVMVCGPADDTGTISVPAGPGAAGQVPPTH